MRRLLLLILFAAGLSQAAIVQSVEFPFDTFPRQFWERELVWLKNIGIRSVTYPTRPGVKNGDEFARIVRRLDITALTGQTLPQPVFSISALSPTALVRSREVLARGTGSLLWTDVEAAVSPAFRKGAISFNGEEQGSLAALGRNAALLQYWGPLMNTVIVSEVHPVSGKFPEGVAARQLWFIHAASVISIVNRSVTAYHGDLRVLYPLSKRAMSLPRVEVPPGEALWLPVNIPLANGPLCKDCIGLGNGDRLIYATAELTAAEYENGILAMEFSAPAAGEVVLQLSRQPTGPLLAAAQPVSFDWDEKTSRVRLAVPAGKGPAHRVRIAIALEPPDSSAFFVDAKFLIIGHPNRIATSYSSQDIAKRSRLKIPANWNVRQEIKSPTELDYIVDVPSDALHGDRVEMELEADGVRMSHARLQLLRPASVRIREAIGLHFGTQAELPVVPALVPVDRTSGRDIALVIRNNFPEIRNCTVEISSSDLQFSPAKREVSIGASMERDVSVRVFATNASAGLHTATIRLSGLAALEIPAQFLVIPRNETVAYRADFDEDGRPEFILENQKIRAVFSAPDGGRWMEFVWKDSGRNVLPEAGVNVGTARLSLNGSDLTIEKDEPLPPEILKSEKHGDIFLDVHRPAPNRSVYTLRR
ncbi:MAG: hypothetical protein M3Z36_07415 [Acidobacteriota bacterium]|nr:hypothetical protein [Acidobacteriota bacterium]